MAFPTIYVRKMSKTLIQFELLSFSSLGNDGWFRPQTQSELLSYGVLYKKSEDIPMIAYMAKRDDTDDDSSEELKVCIGQVSRANGTINFYLHEVCSFNAMQIPKVVENLNSLKSFCKDTWGIKS